MRPAQQRLYAGYLPGGHLHLRLIVQLELIALEGTTQRRFERQAFNRLGLDLLGEEPEGVLAVFLGAIHRHIGFLRQHLHVGTVRRISRDADTGRGMAFVAAQLQRLAENRQQVTGDPLDVMAFRGLPENDDELVAPQSRHHVA